MNSEGHRFAVYGKIIASNLKMASGKYTSTAMPILHR